MVALANAVAVLALEILRKTPVITIGDWENYTKWVFGYEHGVCYFLCVKLGRALKCNIDLVTKSIGLVVEDEQGKVLDTLLPASVSFKTAFTDELTAESFIKLVSPFLEGGLATKEECKLWM